MRRVYLAEMLPVMQEMLNSGGEVTFTVEGSSMEPIMTGGRDTVTLIKPKGKLKKYDLPLYRRENGQFVLHRIVKVTDKGYVMCGDNQFVCEQGIRDENIIGLTVCFTRNGKVINSSDLSYKIYAVVCCNAFARFLKHIKASIKYRLKKLVMSYKR